MKIELEDELVIADTNKYDDKINKEYVCIYIGHCSTTININDLINALQVFKGRKDE